MIVRARQGTRAVGGDWLSAFALFAYAAGFAFAYTKLSAATGALLLFGAVQATMIGNGFLAGERFSKLQLIGLMVAVARLMSLLSPGISRPPLLGSLLMLSAGAAWASIPCAAGVKDIHRNDSWKFPACRADGHRAHRADSQSRVSGQHRIWSAVASGSLASAIGYAIWYTALPALKATHAATVQLSVPVIAALGGIFFLGESLTLRLCVASVAVLGGIALVIAEKPS